MCTLNEFLNLFCETILGAGWPEDALELMFEEFWRSGVPAIGEEGAQGWGQWLSASAQEPPAPNAPKEASASAREEVPTAPDTKQPGDAEEGKSAWVELAPAIRARFGHALRVEDEAGGWTELAPGTENEQEGAKGAGEEDEGLEEESEQEETEEELLARMGMDLEAALAEAEETLTPDLLSSWLELERRRDAAQWQPVRQPPGDNLEAGEDQGVDLLLRACPWKDVVHCAVLFSDPGLKDHLLHGCLNLLGLPQTAVWSSHDAGSHPDDLATALQWVRLGEAISPDPVRQVTAADAAWQWLGGRVVSTREGPWWAGSQERHAFVLRCLEQLLEGPAKGDALVGVMAFHLASWEGLPSASTGSGAAVEGKTEPRWRSEGGRTMAKRLLGRQSGNLVLWGAFAEMELQAGAVKSAKNVCQACLSSIAAPLEPFTPGLAPLALTLCRSILNITYSMGSNRPPVLVEWLLGLGSKWETAAAAAALRPLLWLGSEGNVPLGSAAVAEEAAHEYLAARRGFQAALLRILRGGVKAFDGAARYLISAAATAELLMGAASGKGAGAGAPAALAVYGQVLAALLPEREESDGSSAAVRVPPTCPRALVDLAIERCAVAVDASMHAVRAVPPKTAHDLLHVSLLWFPGHPALLRLLCSLELGGHSVGALRRQLNMHLTAYPACSTWLALVAVEVRTGSPRSAVRAVLERACAHPSGRSCPLLWRIFLRHEAQRPQALHRVFLRAIEACPWDKSVWMDGLALLNGSAPPKELSDYLSAMR